MKKIYILNYLNIVFKLLSVTDNYKFLTLLNGKVFLK